MKCPSPTKFVGGSLLLLLAIGCSDDTKAELRLADAGGPGTGKKDAGDDAGNGDAGAIGKGDAATPNDAGQIVADAGRSDASTGVPDGGDVLSDSGAAGDGGIMLKGDECIGGTRESGKFAGCTTMLGCGELYGRCIAYYGRFRAELFGATLSCHAAASEGLADSCGADSLEALETCAAEMQAAACATAVPRCVAVEERCGAVSASRCEQDLAPVSGDILDTILACFTALDGNAGADCESMWLTCLSPLPE